jgi:hypothetical protein
MESKKVLRTVEDIAGIKNVSPRVDTVRIISPEEFAERMRNDISEMFSSADAVLKEAEKICVSREKLEKEKMKVWPMIEILQKAAAGLQSRTKEKIKQTDDNKSVEERINDLLIGVNSQAEQEI